MNKNKQIELVKQMQILLLKDIQYKQKLLNDCENYVNGDSVHSFKELWELVKEI